MWSITNSSDFPFGISFLVATDDDALKEPFDQMKPFLQQANHVLNNVLFPAGVSINFLNVLVVRPNYGNLLQLHYPNPSLLLLTGYYITTGIYCLSRSSTCHFSCQLCAHNSRGAEGADQSSK